MPHEEVKVWQRIRKDDKNTSLKDVFEKMEAIRAAHPELYVYFDGDEYAICSRPLQRHPAAAAGCRDRAHKDRRKGKQVHFA